MFPLHPSFDLIGFYLLGEVCLLFGFMYFGMILIDGGECFYQMDGRIPQDGV